MILTVTLNPAVDYVVFGDKFRTGETNRGEDIAPDPGGKGNNAARIAHALGAEVHATGLAGGFTGEFIRDSLKAEGIGADFYKTPAPTRITASFIDRVSLEQSKIVPFGPPMAKREIEGFRGHLDRLLQSRSFSIVSMNGSLARGMATDEYEKLIAICAERGVPVLLDTSGEALKSAVGSTSGAGRPLIIKPNLEEARSLCGADKSLGIEGLVELMRPLLESVRFIALTLGAEGALFISKEGSLRGSVSNVAAVNPVCAGDAFVGGFLAAWDRAPGNLETCFGWALAAGSATASAKGLMWEPALFERLLKQVQIQSLR